MPETPKVERAYTVSDATMLERLATIQSLFAEDLADFTAFDADFNATFRDEWTADREAAEALSTDETIQDELADLTQNVDEAMAAGRDKWNEIKYFIKKAFPDRPARQNEFGADDYREASVVQRDFIGFLEKLHAKAEKYKVELIAAKYTQAQIDEIETLRSNLAIANRAQENFKAQRLSDTEDRKIALNKPYLTMVRVNEAAQIIYINSEAKRSQYVFDPNGEGGSGPAVYIGSIGAGEKKNIAEVTYNATRTISLQNTGTPPLQLSLSIAPDAIEGNAAIVAPGATVERTMEELNEDTTATYVVLLNESETSGAYIVTVG